MEVYVGAIFFCQGVFWGMRGALVWGSIVNWFGKMGGRFWDVYTAVKAVEIGVSSLVQSICPLCPSVRHLRGNSVDSQWPERSLQTSSKHSIVYLLSEPHAKSYHNSPPRLLYFFVAAASSALAFALFSLTPTNLASLLASLNLLYAPSSPSGISSLLTSVTASSLRKFLIGNTPCTCFVAFSFSNLEISSLLLSAPLCWPERRGKRIRRSR